MKIFYIAVCMFFFAPAMAQKKGDSKIYITLADTTGAYEKVKLALIKADFIVKELKDSDSIVTYPRDLKTMSGVAVAHANFVSGKVVLYGFYSLKRINYFGYTKVSNDFKPIVYYKKGKLWPLLIKVANDIGGKLEYGD